MADEKIKVLLVDDMNEMRENIRKLLQFEKDIVVVGGARTGREGVEMAKEHQPHVVLMDINMPDMDGIEATEHITREVPRAQIIMLSVQNEPDYLRRAMVAGARDFLHKPPNADQMIAAIRKMYEHAKTVKERPPIRTGGTGDSGAGDEGGGAEIITIYSPKGGVGCTTVATNFAAALKRQKKNANILLVDGNLEFGDIGVFMNIKEFRFTFLDAVPAAGEAAPDINFLLDNVLIEHEKSGISVLLAPPRPEQAEEISAAGVRATLSALQSVFDYIVIDTGSNLTEVLLTYFDLSSRIILVTTPDIPSIAGARKFFDLADALSYPSEQVMFVVNRVDKRGIAAKDIGASLKQKVRGEVPFDHYGVLKSINQGIPLMLYPKANPVAAGVYNLVKAVLADLVPEVEEEPVLARRGAKQPAKTKKPARRRLFGA